MSRPRAGSMMMTATLAVAAAVAGCGNVTPAASDGGAGGGAGDGGDAGVTLTAAQACSQEAKAICDALAGCAAFWVQLLYGDKTTCISRQSLSCMDDQNAAGTTRTISDLAACAQAAATSSCADLVAGKYPTACAVKPGTVMSGLPCGSDWQCQSTYCSKGGQACGVCGPRVAAGGDCTADAGCQSGMVCANSKCVTPGESGAGCEATNQPCRGDLYCPGTGRCAPKLGAGGSCADTDKACDVTQGIGCNPFNHVCEAVAVAKGGAACGIVNRTLTLCVGLNPCPGQTLTQPGVCANPAEDGAACGGAAGGRNCVAPASCDMMICRLSSATSCK